MDPGDFQRRLRGILGDPVLSLPVLDERTEEPYLQLSELFIECDEEQRGQIRSGWPYGREWRVPVPGTTYDWRGARVTERRLRASLVAEALRSRVDDFRDIVIGFPVWLEVAREAGLDADRVFRQTAKTACPEVRQVMEDWINAPSRASPEKMGWHLIDTPDGRRYKLG